MARTKIDDAKLIRKIERLPAKIRQHVDREFEKSARLLVSSSGKVPGLVQVTPPHSEGKRGNAAKKQGEAAVESDIRSVYARPGELASIVKSYGGQKMMREFWWVFKNLPFADVKKWIEREAPAVIQAMTFGFDDGAEHAKRRNKRGRVTGKPTVIIPPEDERKLDRYIKRKKGHVGMLAASSVMAASATLGTLTGVPAWVARHKVHWARVHDVGDGMKRVITVALLAPYMVKDMQRRWTYVVHYREQAFRRQLPFIVKHAMKSAAAQLA